MKTVLLIICMVFIELTVNAQNTTYFVSPYGNDIASGLSIKDAWKSLDKVNSVTFLPGDKILFESGGIWKGQLKLKGSGIEGNPILLSNYGGKDRPVIYTGKAEGAGIRLYNQSWWIVENMEITSGAAPELGTGRQGIAAIVRGADQHVENIIIRNCYIHDIWGQLGGNTEFTGYNSCAIVVQMQNEKNDGCDDNGLNATLDNVLIENNHIERCDKCGIVVRGCKRNLNISHNYMENIGGDGILASGCYKGMIEHNVAKRTCMRSGYMDLKGGETWWPHTAAIWIMNAQETVMQYNEVYDTGRQPGNGDGFAFDFDYYCKHCVLQYNYSQNNHGFLLFMGRTFENIARYNISENDQTHLVQMQCEIGDRNMLHNNIFYIDYGTVDIDFFCGNDGMVNKTTIGAAFCNNIFYATGQSCFRTVYSKGETLGRTFDESVKVARGMPYKLFYNNCYFGLWKNGIPNDPNKLIADPLFIAPGTGKEGFSSLTGYQLQSDSPCINAGFYIPLSGKYDFWGNPIEDGLLDVGVYEQIGTGVFANKIKMKEDAEKYKKESDSAWLRWNSNGSEN